MKTFRVCGCILPCLFLIFPLLANAAEVDDAGPLETVVGEYKYDAMIDNEVLVGKKTELWAAVTRPKDLPKEKMPLIIFLHGNHGTCGRGKNPRLDNSCAYTKMGACPADYVVTPNHLGYQYVAKNLASWGYLVFSINANLGITCGDSVAGDSGLNLARGRLILRHLEKIALWNTKGDAPKTLSDNDKIFLNKIDFSRVAMVGHSRGGEGVRAAYNIFLDEGSPWPARIGDVRFNGIFEIAPVDGQTTRVLNAEGVRWNLLLPMCDGDVNDLQGIKVFNRMLRAKQESHNSAKSVFSVWGANHNFYNSEWQTSDSRGCKNHDPIFNDPDEVTGSAKQRKTGSHSLIPFIHAIMRADGKVYDRIFDTKYPLPKIVSENAYIDRAFQPTLDQNVVRVVEDFALAAGKGKSGKDIESKNVTYTHTPGAESSMVAAEVIWNSASDENYISIPVAAKSLDVTDSDDLSFLVRRERGENVKIPTDFNVVLVDGENHQSSPVQISKVLALYGPVNNYGTINSVNLSLDWFSGVDLRNIVAVKFVFNISPAARIALAHIAFSKRPIADDFVKFKRDHLDPFAFTTDEPEIDDPIVRFAGVQPVQGSADGNTGYEIVLEANQPMPVLNFLPSLAVGDKLFDQSRFPEDGSLNRIYFRVDRETWSSMKAGIPMHFSYPRKQFVGVLTK